MKVIMGYPRLGKLSEENQFECEVNGGWMGRRYTQ